MSRHISVESIQGKQRKEISEEIQQQAKKAALSAIKNVLEAGLEAEVEGQLGRKKGEVRLSRSQGRLSEWRCGHCGSQNANQFLRYGHYRRNAGNGMGTYPGTARSYARVSTVRSRCDLRF